MECKECKSQIEKKTANIGREYWWCLNDKCKLRHNGWVIYKCKSCSQIIHPELEIMKIIGKIDTYKDRRERTLFIEEMKQGEYICNHCNYKKSDKK